MKQSVHEEWSKEKGDTCYHDQCIYNNLGWREIAFLATGGFHGVSPDW